MKKQFLFVALFCFIVIVSTVQLFAQEQEYPGFYNSMFSETFLLAVTAIIGFTKLIRNMINVKGWVAIVITFVISMVYGFIQYNAQGIEYSLGAGLFAFLASAGVFTGSKLFGKKINPNKAL